MKYNNLINEFERDQSAIESISNSIAVDVIDKMFDTYAFNQYELDVLIKAVGLFEGNKMEEGKC